MAPYQLQGVIKSGTLHYRLHRVSHPPAPANSDTEVLTPSAAECDCTCRTDFQEVTEVERHHWGSPVGLDAYQEGQFRNGEKKNSCI